MNKRLTVVSDHDDPSPPPESFADHMTPDELARFGRALEDIARRAREQVGEDDLDHLRRVDRASRWLEGAGRALIAGSFEPAGFSLGVLLLAAYKLLQAAEIGHPVLHGSFDRIDPRGRYHSRRFRWEFPIDEASWRHGHNLRHHTHTNIVGHDPDVTLGFVRLTRHSPHRWLSYAQLPAIVLGGLPNFTFLANLQFTGMLDLLLGNGLKNTHDLVPDRSPRTAVKTLARALRKPLRYYGKNFVLWPALFGPLWPKVLAGNALAEMVRDVYIGLVILCGHTGAAVRDFPAGTKATGKHRWFVMQIEAAQNFQIPVPILCGGLDRQIEHHLFPDLPARRLREIAPAVQSLCRSFGVPYRNPSFARAVAGALVHIARLSRPGKRLSPTSQAAAG